MKTDKKTKETVRQLLDELADLEAAMDIKDNYDAEIYVLFTTSHNHNKESGKSVKLKMAKALKEIAISEVKERIAEINKNLEKL